jgi:hypothetical protein
MLSCIGKPTVQCQIPPTYLNASKWENENIYKNFISDTKNDDKTDMAAIIISDQISFTERNAILSIIGEKFCLYQFLKK